MADVNRGNRPLSPHVSIYRMPLNAVLSITHRITGVGMSLASVLIVWYFLAAATSEAYFDTASWVLTSFLGDLIMLGSLMAIWYHFCSGIRHLVWDTGSGLGQRRVQRSGITALIAAAVLTLITIILA
ncbi:succinate dehydrogenase, cytochrome b556 subunit [Aliiroseovarius sp.]|uniref:succinate dehydrogenase, cytochrome b556 subunit n=1 Tax=Aliiroseovarius sp. TaxID=1872442 RepID=UPI0026389CC5|nr:succinate dehydrogenase, cytochrome b556 subunit [Aliiroseovarius sp.]